MPAGQREHGTQTTALLCVQWDRRVSVSMERTAQESDGAGSGSVAELALGSSKVRVMHLIKNPLERAYHQEVRVHVEATCARYRYRAAAAGQYSSPSRSYGSAKCAEVASEGWTGSNSRSCRSEHSAEEESRDTGPSYIRGVARPAVTTRTRKQEALRNVHASWPLVGALGDVNGAPHQLQPEPCIPTGQREDGASAGGVRKNRP